MDRSFQMTIYEQPLYSPTKKRPSHNSITKNGVKKMFVLSDEVYSELENYMYSRKIDGENLRYSDIANAAFSSFFKKNV